jgi:hypothetical protein
MLASRSDAPRIPSCAAAAGAPDHAFAFGVGPGGSDRPPAIRCHGHAGAGAPSGTVCPSGGPVGHADASVAGWAAQPDVPGNDAALYPEVAAAAVAASGGGSVPAGVGWRDHTRPLLQRSERPPSLTVMR